MVVLVLMCSSCVAIAQPAAPSPLPYAAPESCREAAGGIFQSGNLSCVTCPTNSESSADGISHAASIVCRSLGLLGCNYYTIAAVVLLGCLDMMLTTPTAGLSCQCAPDTIGDAGEASSSAPQCASCGENQVDPSNMAMTEMIISPAH